MRPHWPVAEALGKRNSYIIPVRRIAIALAFASPMVGATLTESRASMASGAAATALLAAELGSLHMVAERGAAAAHGAPHAGGTHAGGAAAHGAPHANPAHGEGAGAHA